MEDLNEEGGGVPAEEGAGRAEDELDRLIRRRSGSDEDRALARPAPEAGGMASAEAEGSSEATSTPGQAVGGGTSPGSEPPPPGFIVRRIAVPPLDRPVADGERLWVNRYAGVLGGVAILAALVVTWRLLTDIVAGGSIRAFVDQLLSMKDPFRPLPAPEDPVVTANLSLRSAARVAAPLVIAVFWFAGGFQIDRAARRAFEVRRTLATGLPKAYSAVAIGCVFPLLVGGVIGLAWGGISLAAWSMRNQAWLPTVQLLGLLMAFGLAARVIDAMQEGWNEQRRRIRR